MNRSIRITAGRALLWTDRFLCSRQIPSTHFGWETQRLIENDIGGPTQAGVWHFSDAERQPFHRHNEWLQTTAAKCRAIAASLGVFRDRCTRCRKTTTHTPFCIKRHT